MKEGAAGASRVFLTSGLAVACEGSEVDEVETGDGSNIGTDMRFSITVGAIFSLSLQRSVEAHQLSHVWLFVGISSCASNNICCTSVGNRSSRQWSFSCCPQAKRRRARAKKKSQPVGCDFSYQLNIRTRRLPGRRTYAAHPGISRRCCRWSACNAAGQRRFLHPRPA